MTAQLSRFGQMPQISRQQLLGMRDTRQVRLNDNSNLSSPTKKVKQSPISKPLNAHDELVRQTTQEDLETYRKLNISAMLMRQETQRENRLKSRIYDMDQVINHLGLLNSSSNERSGSTKKDPSEYARSQNASANTFARASI